MANNPFDSTFTGRSKSLFALLPLLAKKTTFIMRKRKLTAELFLLCLFKSLFNGKASFQQIAARFGRLSADSISKQALWKRIDASAIAFLMSTFAAALAQRGKNLTQKHPRLGTLFNRILTEDSTQHRFHHSNVEDFKAHGNGISQTAGVKVDLTFDLLTGLSVQESIHLATTQDKEIGKDLIDLVLPNDLILRDMGYFSLAEFTIIEEKNAWWLSRTPINLIITYKGKSLEKTLKKSQTSTIDLEVTLGEVRKKARLVGMMATPQTAAKNIREAREKARKRGHTLSAEEIERCRWHLVATNVPREMMNVKEISDLYTCRWNIEIIFRAWKQGMNLGGALNRQSNQYHLQALVLVAMIYQVLALQIVALLRARYVEETGQVSIEKVFHDFGEYLSESPNLKNLKKYHPDWRDIRMDPRKDRKPLIETLLDF